MPTSLNPPGPDDLTRPAGRGLQGLGRALAACGALGAATLYVSAALLTTGRALTGTVLSASW